MATSSSKAAPATTAAIGSDAASNTSETIVGSHVFTIDGFSTTKDLGVGMSANSSTFRVGGHGWYIECYPCGDVEDSAGWVTLFLHKQEYQPGTRVSGQCEFTLIESLKGSGKLRKLIEFKDHDMQRGIHFIEREELEWRLKDDCFHVRCIVLIEKFASVPLTKLATETVAGSHILRVEGYSKTWRTFDIDDDKSSRFSVGAHSWYVELYPCGGNKEDTITAILCLDDPVSNEQVKVRFQISLLTHTGQIISSIQDFSTFSESRISHSCTFLTEMELESSPLLQDGIQIRCDIAIVNAITAVQVPPERPDLHRHLGDLLESQVGTDVTFEVGGELFSAHKNVLSTRSTAFMAEFFGQAGKQNSGVNQVLRIDDIEPRVFKVLLHFIYTDALPEVREEDKVVMAQGLLVAADRYAIERLKFICGDILCSCIDKTTAVATLDLADKYGCLKLKDVCIEVIKDWLAKFTS